MNYKAEVKLHNTLYNYDIYPVAGRGGGVIYRSPHSRSSASIRGFGYIKGGSGLGPRLIIKSTKPYEVHTTS